MKTLSFRGKPVSEKKVEIRNGFSINAYDSLWDSQPQGGRKNLVFIHGAAGRLGMWQEQLDSFAPERRVVLLDIAGHGGSDRAKGYRKMEKYSDDLGALLAVLDVKPQDSIIAGYSLGANIAYTYARANETAGTVLVGMHASKNWLTMSYRTLRLIATDILRKTWPEYRTGWTLRGFSSAVLSYMREDELGPQKEQSPALIINGENDIMSPKKDAIELQKRIPNSLLFTFPGASHAVHMLADFNRLLSRFAAGLD